jgi:hypothetical protein
MCRLKSFLSYIHCLRTQIRPDAFDRLRAFRLRLAVRGTGVREWPPLGQLVDRLKHVRLLTLDLRDNQLETVRLFENGDDDRLKSAGGSPSFSQVLRQN